MKEQKAVLTTIIVLLVIFLPLSVIGVVKNISDNKKEKNAINPNHELYYKNSIWFYDNDKLISSYKCINSGCKLAESSINDDEYNINYYKDGKEKILKPFNNKYAFIEDGEYIYLVDISTKTTLNKYGSIKNYYTVIEHKRLIMENNEGKWGVLGFESVLENAVPFDYDFVGLVNNINDDNTLLANKFIVRKDGKWFIINEKNEPLCGEFDNPIVDHNDLYIVTYDKSSYYISNYAMENYFNNQKISYYTMLDKYIGIVLNNVLYIYDNPKGIHIGNIEIKGIYKNIKLEIKDNNLNVLIDGNIVNTIEIS